MCVNLGWSDDYVRERTADLRREAERDRLADLAVQPGRPVRARLADGLIALADWIRPADASASRYEAAY